MRGCPEFETEADLNANRILALGHLASAGADAATLNASGLAAGHVALSSSATRGNTGAIEWLLSSAELSLAAGLARSESGLLPLSYGLAEWAAADADSALRSGWASAVAKFAELWLPGDACLAEANAEAVANCLRQRSGDLHELIAADDRAGFDAAPKVSPWLNEKDAAGRTPLHHAATVSNKHYMTVLLRQGADVNAGASDGASPVHYAVSVRDAHGVSLMARGFNDVSPNYNPSGALVALSDFPYAPLEYAGRLRLESSDDSERTIYAKIILLLRRSGGLCSAALADAAYVDCVSARETDDARRALALVRSDDAAGLRELASAVQSRNESATVFASYRDSDGGNLLHHSARFGATAALTYLLTMTGEDGSTSATVFSERLDLQNTHGASPLHSAVLGYAHGRVWEVASRLLDAGADGRALMRISPAKWFSLTDESLDGSGSDLALTPLDAALRLLARGSESLAHRRLGAAIIRLNARVARGCTASAESDAYADCALESLLTVPEQDSIMSSSRVAVRRVAAGYLGSVAYFAAGNGAVRWDELSPSAGFGASADGSGLAVFLTERLSGGASAMGEVDALARLAPYTDTPVALRVEVRALANPVGVASGSAPLSGVVYDFGGQGYANGAYDGASFRKVNGSPELSVSESGLVSVALADGLGVGEYEVAAAATRDDFLGEAFLTLKLSAPGRKVSAETALEVWSTVASAAEGFEGPGWTLVASPGYDLDFESLPAGFALNELSGRRWELELTRPLGAVELGVALGAAVICDAGDCAPDSAVTALATFVPVSDPGQAKLQSAYGEAIAHELRLPLGYESNGAFRVLGLADYFSVANGTLAAGVQAPPVGLYTVTVGFSHSGFLGELGLAVGAEVVPAEVVPAEGVSAVGLNPPLVKVAFGHAGEVHRVSPQDSELRFGELPSPPDGVSLALESDDREVVFSLTEPLESSSPELSALFSLTLIRTGGNYQSLSQAVRLRVTTLAEPGIVSLFGEAAGLVLYENAALHDFRAGDYANARFESSGGSSALGVSSAGVVSVVSPLGAGDYGLTIAARSADYVGEAKLTLSLAVTLALVAEEDSIPLSARGLSRWVAADYAGSVAFYAARHPEVSLLIPSEVPSGFSFSAGASGITLLAEALPGGRLATAAFALTARRSGYADAPVGLRATIRFVANPLTEIVRPTRAAGDVATLTLSNFSDVQYAGASADAPLEWSGATLRATAALSPGTAYYAVLHARSSGFLGILRLTAKVEAALARFAGRALTRPYDALSPDGNAGAVAIARRVVPERGNGPGLDFPMRYHGVRRGLHVIYLPADDVDAAAGSETDVDGYYRRICAAGGSESGDNAWRLASASEALGLLLDTGRTDLTFCPNASAFSNLPGAPSGYALALPPELESPDAVAAGALPYSELSERGYATDLWAGTGLQVAPSGVCNLERNVSPRHPGALCVSEIAGYAAGHSAPPVGVMILDAVNGTLGVRPGNFRYADSISVSYAAPFSGELYTVTMRAWRYDYDSVSLESDVSLAEAVLLRGTELRVRTEYLSEGPGVARVILETESGAVLLGNRTAVLRLEPAHVGSDLELTVLLRGSAAAEWHSGSATVDVFARGDRFSARDQGRALDATYLGRRRGLHVMRLEGVHPAETGARVCAAGRTSRTAWRPPGLAELTGLYLDGSAASAGRALSGVAKFGTAAGIAGLRDGLRFGLGAGAGDAPALRSGGAVAYGNVFDGSGRAGLVFDNGLASSALSFAGGSHFCVAAVLDSYVPPPEPAGLRLSLFGSGGSGGEVAAETAALTAEGRTYVGVRDAVLTVRVRAWRWGSGGAATTAADASVSFRLASGGEFGLRTEPGSGGIFTVAVSATVAVRAAGARLMTLFAWPSPPGATATLELSVDAGASREPLSVVFSSTAANLTAAAGYVGPLFTVTGSWPRSEEERPNAHVYDVIRGPDNLAASLVADPENPGNNWGAVYSAAPGLSGGLLATVEVEARAQRDGRVALGRREATLRSLDERPLIRHPLITASAPEFHATLSLAAEEHPGPFSFADASGSDSELRIAEVDGRGVVSLANPLATLSGGTHTVVARATAAGLLGGVMFTVEVPVIGVAARFAGEAFYVPGDRATLAGIAAVYHGVRRGRRYVSSARDYADSSGLRDFCARDWENWRPATLAEFMGLFAPGDSAVLGEIPPGVSAPGLETGYAVSLSPLGPDDAPPPSFLRGYPNVFLQNDSSSGALLSADDFRLLNGPGGPGGRLVCVSHSVAEEPPSSPTGAIFLSGHFDGAAGGRVSGATLTAAIRVESGDWRLQWRSYSRDLVFDTPQSGRRLTVSLSAAEPDVFGIAQPGPAFPRRVSVWQKRVSGLSALATLWAWTEEADGSGGSGPAGPRARYVLEFDNAEPPSFAGVGLGAPGVEAWRDYNLARNGEARRLRFVYGGVSRGLHYVVSRPTGGRGGRAYPEDAAGLCAGSEGWRAPTSSEFAGLRFGGPAGASSGAARLAAVSAAEAGYWIGAEAGEWMPGVARRPDGSYVYGDLVLAEPEATDALMENTRGFVAEHYLDSGGEWRPAELATYPTSRLRWNSEDSFESFVVCVLEKNPSSYRRPPALSGLRLFEGSGRELGRTDQSMSISAKVYFAGRGAALSLSRYYYGPGGAAVESGGEILLDGVSGPALSHYAIRPDSSGGGLAVGFETLESSARESAATLALSGLGMRATAGLALLPQDHTFGGVGGARFPLRISHPESGAVAALTLGGFLEHDGLYWLFSDGAHGEGYAAAICAAGTDDNFAWRSPRLAELMRLQGVTILFGAGSGLAGWRSGLRVAESVGVSESPVRIAWLDLHRSDGLETLWSLENQTVQEYDQASGLTAHAACVAPSSSAYVSPSELSGARLVPSGFFLSGTTLTVSGLGVALLTAHAESWRWDSRGQAMAVQGEGRSSIRFASGNATLHSFSFADSFGTVYAATAALVYDGDRTVMRWNNPGTLPESGATLTLSTVPPFGAETTYAAVLVDRERLSADGFLAETPARRAVAAGYAGPVLRIQSAAVDDSIGAISADLPHPLTLSGETIALASGLSAGARLIATLTVEALSPNRLAALAEQVLEVSSLPSFGVVSATTAAGIADVFVTEIGGALLADYPEARFAFHAGAGFDVSPSGVVSATAALEAGRIFEAVAAATVAGSAANVFLGTILLTAEVTTRAAADSVLFNHRPFYAGEANEFGLVYHGPRRGMQVAYSESEVSYGDANPISFCAAGSAEGWRAPSPSEYAALFSDARSSVGATLRVARKAGVARIHAGFGAALSLTMPRSRNGVAPSFSRGYADFYVREDGRTTALPIEIDSGDNFVAGLSETGRLICVLGPDEVSHPRGVAALWLNSGGVEVTAFAGGYSDESDSFSVPTMTAAIELAGSAVDVSLRAWRPHGSDSLLENALVSVIALPESELFLLLRTADGFRVAAKDYDTGLGRSERLTLAVSSPLGGSDDLMTLLVYAAQPEVVFRADDGANLIFTAPGQAAGGARYVGHRRGARFVVSENAMDDSSARSFCDSSAGLGWRLPSLGEAAGLLTDAETARVAGFDAGFAESALTIGSEIPLPKLSADAVGVSTERLFADYYGSESFRSGIASAGGESISLYASGAARAVCVLPDADYDYAPAHPAFAHFGADWENAATLGARPAEAAVWFSKTDAVEVFYRLTVRAVRNGGGGRTLAVHNALALTLSQAGSDFAMLVNEVSPGETEVLLSLANADFLGDALLTVRAQPSPGVSQFAAVSLHREDPAGVFGLDVYKPGSRATIRYAGDLGMVSPEGMGSFTLRYGGVRRGLHVMVQEYENASALGGVLTRPDVVCAAGSEGRYVWRLPSLTELAGLRTEGDASSALVRMSGAHAPGLAADESRRLILHPAGLDDDANSLGDGVAALPMAFYAAGGAGRPDTSLGVEVDGVLPLVKSDTDMAAVCVLESEDDYEAPPELVAAAFPDAPSQAAPGRGDAVSLTVLALRLNELGETTSAENELLRLSFRSDSSSYALDALPEVRSGTVAKIVLAPGAAIPLAVNTITIIATPRNGTEAVVAVELFPPLPAARFAEGTAGEALLYDDGPRFVQSFRAEVIRRRVDGFAERIASGLAASVLAAGGHFELEELAGGQAGSGAAAYHLNLKVAGSGPSSRAIVSVLAWPSPGPGVTAVYELTTRRPAAFAAYPKENGVEFDRTRNVALALASTLSHGFLTITARAYLPGYRGPRRSGASLVVSLATPFAGRHIEIPGLYSEHREAITLQSRPLANGVEMILRLDDYSLWRGGVATLTATAYPSGGNAVDDGAALVLALSPEESFAGVPIWQAGASVAISVPYAGEDYAHTLAYLGTRRGLRVMRVGASELASLGAGGRYDELASALCMAGGSGWRLPSLMESAGLLTNGSEVRVAADDVDAFEVAGAADEILFSPLATVAGDAAALGGTVFAGLHGIAAGDDFPRLARAFRQASGVAAFRGDESLTRADVACVRPEDSDSYFVSPDPSGISLTIVSSVVAYDSADVRTLAFRFSTWRYGKLIPFTATDNSARVSLKSEVFRATLLAESDGAWRGEVWAASLALGDSLETIRVDLETGDSREVEFLFRGPPVPEVRFGGLSAVRAGWTIGVFAATNVHSGGGGSFRSGIQSQTGVEVTLIYAGKRRGLFAAVSADDFAEGFQDSVCAMGTEGWRVPNLSEMEGLVSDAHPILATLRGTVRVLGLSSGTTLTLSPLEISPSDSSPLSSGGWADIYRETAHSQSGLHPAYAVGGRKILCVLPESKSYVAPTEPAGVHFIFDGRVSATVAGVDREEPEVVFSARSHRRLRTGAFAAAGLPEVRMTSAHTLFAEFYNAQTIAADGDGSHLQIAVRRRQEAPPEMTLAFHANHLQRSARLLLAITIHPGVARFNGAVVSDVGGGALAARRENAVNGSFADVVLRYYRARGLHYLVSDSSLADGWQEAACELGNSRRGDDAWRLPKVGEALGLTEAGDSFVVSATVDLPDGFATGQTLQVGESFRSGIQSPTGAVQSTMRSDGVFADSYLSAANFGGKNRGLNAHDFGKATGRVACVAPVNSATYAPPEEPLLVRWESAAGEALGESDSVVVPADAPPTQDFYTARARAVRAARVGVVAAEREVVVAAEPGLHILAADGGTVRLSGLPGNVRLRAAARYGENIGLAVSLLVEARREGAIFFGARQVVRGEDFPVNGVAGEDYDPGPLNITATYAGRIRGLHVVRSELGPLVPRPAYAHRNQGEYDFHAGPYGNDYDADADETPYGHATPLRPDGFQRNFCAAGNGGLGAGWRQASAAELAALQIADADYVLKESDGGGGGFFVGETPTHNLHSDPAAGEYHINLGPTAAGDAPLLPPMLSPPRDMHSRWANRNADGRTTTARGRIAGGGYYRLLLAETNNVLSGIPFLAKRRRDTGDRWLYNIYGAVGYLDGWVYVCVKDAEGADRPLPMTGDASFSESVRIISPPYSRVLARVKLSVTGRNHRGVSAVWNRKVPVSVVGDLPNIELQTELLPGGETNVQVVWTGDGTVPVILTVTASAIGKGASFYVATEDALFFGNNPVVKDADFVVEDVPPASYALSAAPGFAIRVDSRSSVNITATYVGRIRGMHVVRSELGGTLNTPSHWTDNPFSFHVGPYNGAVPLRDDAYPIEFCNAGNSGLGRGWRHPSLAELAALQIPDRNFSYRRPSGYWIGQLVRPNVPPGRYPIDLGPLDPDDAPLLPDIFALPSDLHMYSFPSNNSAFRRTNSGLMNVIWAAGTSAESPGTYLRPPIPFVARQHLPENWKGFSSHPSGKPHYFGAIYVCVKDDAENPRPRLPQVGNAEFGVERIITEVKPVLAVATVTVFGTDQYWIKTPRNSPPSVGFTNPEVPYYFALETTDLGEGGTEVRVLMTDLSATINLAGDLTIMATPKLGASDSFVVEIIDGVFFSGYQLLNRFGDRRSSGASLQSHSNVVRGDGFVMRNVVGIHEGYKGPINITARYHGKIRGMHVVHSEFHHVPYSLPSRASFPIWHGFTDGRPINANASARPRGYHINLCARGNGSKGRGWRHPSMSELMAIQTARTLVTMRNPGGSFPGITELNLGNVDNHVLRLPPLGPDDDPLLPDVASIAEDLFYKGVSAGNPLAYKSPGSSDANVSRHEATFIPRSTFPDLYRGYGYTFNYVYFCVRDVDPEAPTNFPLWGNAEVAPRNIVTATVSSRVVAVVTASAVGRNRYWNRVLRDSDFTAEFVGGKPSFFNLETKTLDSKRTEIRVVADDIGAVPSSHRAVVRVRPSFGGHMDFTVNIVDGLYFGGTKLAFNQFNRQTFMVNGITGRHNKQGDKPINIEATYEGHMRGFHIVRSEYGPVARPAGYTDIDTQYGLYDPAPPPTTDYRDWTGNARPDGYQHTFCAAGNTGSGVGWRQASAAELAAIQYEGERLEVVIGGSIKSKGNPNNAFGSNELTPFVTVGFENNVLELGPPFGNADLLPNLFTAASDIYGNACNWSSTIVRDNNNFNFDCGVGQQVLGSHFTPRYYTPQNSNGYPDFGAHLGNHPSMVYVCVRDVDGAPRPRPSLAGNVEGAPDAFTADLSSPAVAVLTLSVVGVGGQRNRVLRDQPLATVLGSPDYLRIEDNRLADGRREIRAVVIGRILGDAQQEFNLRFAPPFGLGQDTDVRYPGADWLNRLRALGDAVAEGRDAADAAATLTLAHTSTEFGGATLSFGNSTVIRIPHADSQVNFQVEYRGVRRGLHYATARPAYANVISGWHRARDAVCAAGGAEWRAANLAEVLGGGRSGRNAAIDDSELVPGLGADALATLPPENAGDRNDVLTGGIFAEHGTGTDGGENVYLQLSPDAATGAPAARVERVHSAETVRPIVCVRAVDEATHVRQSDAVEKMLYAPPGSPVLTVTAFSPPRPGAESYADSVFTFEADPRRRSRDDDDVLVGGTIAFETPSAHPVAEFGEVNGRNVYGIRVNPGRLSGGVEIPVVLRAALGAEESFRLRVSVAYVARVPAGLSFGGRAISELEGAVSLAGLRNALDGSSGGAELRYYGVRRGLHVARTTLDFADGWQESCVCGGECGGLARSGFCGGCGFGFGGWG